jgi:hypothetical protein
MVYLSYGTGRDPKKTGARSARFNVQLANFF